MGLLWVGGKSSRGLLRQPPRSELLGGGKRGGGQNVEVTGIGRQIVGRTFDLEEYAGLDALERADSGNFHWIVGAEPLELHLLLEPIARNICTDLRDHRSEEHTSELQSLMRISYAVFCLKKKQTLK